MKRFFCTVCNKYKRVRVMPDSVRNPDAVKPADRVGQCKWHATAVNYTRKIGA